MRKFIIKCTNMLAGLSVGLVSTVIYAENLMSVYQLALENDNELSAARNENEAAQQAGRQLTGLYYPSMDLGFDHIETNQVINRSENDVFGSGESDFPTDVLSLSLKQPIFRWDYFSQRKVAKAEISQADYLLAAAEQGLMLRTAESYLLTLAAWDNQLVTKAERDAVEAQLRLAEKRLEVGLAHPTEVHESRARFEFNESELIVAENQVIDQEEGLRVIVGRSITDLQPLQDAFEMVVPEPNDESSWINSAIENNLTVKARQAAADVALAEFEVQKADRYPTVDFVANFNNRDSGGSLFGGGSDVDTTDLIVRANWKVFQGGILRARIKEALYNKQRAEDGLALEQAKVRREARKSYRAVVSAIAKSRALKTSMEAQQQAVQAKIKGFETGANSNIDVLDAKRDFFFVQRDYLKSRYEYLLGLLNLKLQVGSLSPEDLNMVNGMLKAEGSAANTPQLLFPAVMVAATVAVSEVSADAPGEEKQASSAESEGVEDAYQWLLDKPDDAYTLLVASLKSEQAAGALTQSLEDSRYFYAENKWYFVLSGTYSDATSARAAALAMGHPDALLKTLATVKEKRCQAAPQLQNMAVSIEQLCADAGWNTTTVQSARDVALRKNSVSTPDA